MVEEAQILLTRVLMLLSGWLLAAALTTTYVNECVLARFVPRGPLSALSRKVYPRLRKTGARHRRDYRSSDPRSVPNV